MTIRPTMMRVLAIAGIVGVTSLGTADVITSPTYFDGLDSVTIDFETEPGGTDTLPDNTVFTTLFVDLGVVFSSETTPGTGVFDGPMRSLGPISGGGSPTSGSRYAGGNVYLNLDTSAQRIEFTLPVSAVAMYVIDNDFSDVTMTAYDAGGDVIEQVFIPEVVEGGFGYHGIAAPGIASVIIDGAAGEPMDSTYIDDLTFVAGPCSDGVVGVTDLLVLLSQWGPCPPGCLMDLDDSGEVDVADLLALLAAWGPCP